MANEKRLIDATAECFEEVTKIKTHFAKIIVEGTTEHPYYSILYYDPKRKEYFNGYGSYYIANVFGWLNECFEIEEMPIVDAVEVVHGHWIECEGTVCSVCNKHFFVDGPWAVANYRANYCPNCGAKMDGGYRKCVDIAQQPLWD